MCGLVLLILFSANVILYGMDQYHTHPLAMLMHHYISGSLPHVSWCNYRATGKIILFPCMMRDIKSKRNLLGSLKELCHCSATYSITLHTDTQETNYKLTVCSTYRLHNNY